MSTTAGSAVRLPGPAQGVRQDDLQMGVPGHRWVFTAVVPHDHG